MSEGTIHLDEFGVAGKVALVTGGTRGLGRAICNGFAARGTDLVVAARDPAACLETARELEAAGIAALAVPTDVSRWDDCDRLLEATYDRFGRLDILVNNAGLAPREEAAEATRDGFDAVLAVNAAGPFRLAVMAGARMDAGGGGSIVNISSLASVRSMPDVIPYSLAKGGVNSLTTGLAGSLGPRVRVNAVLPGFMRTEMSDQWEPELLDRFAKKRIWMGRIGEPDEIVGTVLYLAGACSSYTSGAVIRVDGGC